LTISFKDDSYWLGGATTSQPQLQQQELDKSQEIMNEES